MLCFRETSIGIIGIEEKDGAIRHLCLPPQAGNPAGKGEPASPARPESGKESPLLKEAFAQLDAYLAGKRRSFDLPLRPEGTPFMQKVWRALCDIPYGATASYKDIAAVTGNVRAVRAVGLANNRNPIAIFIPCHRVIGSNGKLVGYGGGLDMKRRLLDLEASHRMA